MDSKDCSMRKSLKEFGVLHPHPEKVSAALVGHSEFFDPGDLAQMKYEMLRVVKVEGLSASDAARRFGLSRVAFYHASRQFNEKGMPGLLPERRGPKRPHKFTEAIMAFAMEWIEMKSGKPPNWRGLSRDIEKKFGVSIHSHSVARAFKAAKKK